MVSTKTCVTGNNFILHKALHCGLKSSKVGRSDGFAAPSNMGRPGSEFSDHSLLSHNIPVRLKKFLCCHNVSP